MNRSTTLSFALGVVACGIGRDRNGDGSDGIVDFCASPDARDLRSMIPL